MRENETAHLVQQKLDLLQSELQLAHERERAATQTTTKATKMTEIAQDRAAKATENERKFWVSSVQANEIAVRALEQERKCRIVLILSWFIYLFIYFGYVVFMFWLKWECWNDEIESAWWVVI